ncbi:MAG: TonB family protein [Phycisphaerales bacterium]
MSQAPSRSWPLILALLLSLLLHAGGAWVVTSVSMSEASDAAGDAARFERPPDPASPEVRLGSVSSTASTMVWIGYDEFEAQQAPKSEVEQAAFAPESPAVPAEKISESTPESPNPEKTDAEVTPAETAPETPKPSESPPPTPAAPAEFGPPAPIVDQTGPPLVLRDAAATPEEVAEADPKEEKPAKPTQSAGAPAPAAQPGNETPKESVASSIKDAIEYRPGKPLAAAGLDIQTVRPVFSKYTRLTARPQDTVVRIQFDHRGKVVDAEFLQSSGNRDVDRSVLDALYRWRAQGTVLKGLGANNEETVSVDIRMIL